MNNLRQLATSSRRSSLILSIAAVSLLSACNKEDGASVDNGPAVVRATIPTFEEVERPEEPITDGPDSKLMLSVPDFASSSEAENLDPIGKVDFLFVVDNSISMYDKQELLEQAVPGMIEALVSPPCYDTDGLEQDALSSGDCPPSTERPYAPLTDINIGIITSSLGIPGSDRCSESNQAGRLISSNDDSSNDDSAADNETIDESATDEDDGESSPSVDAPPAFLSWRGGDQTANEELLDNFSANFALIGEEGCGYEATLESFYRFLVDPTPVQNFILNEGILEAERDEDGELIVDEKLLAQREAFLRPDSLVNIIILTDEDDCSIKSGGPVYPNADASYLIANFEKRLNVASAQCEENPNDRCCFSCLGVIPEGCSAEESLCDELPLTSTECSAQRTACAQSDRTVMECNDEETACEETATLKKAEDAANLRCFDQKRRFGVDLLYPTQRYVDALKKRKIYNSQTGELVDNPLLMGAGEVNNGKARPAGRIYLTGIVGVPWQDIVTNESLDDPDTLTYLRSEELLDTFQWQGETINRWDLLLGRPGIPLDDPICQDDPETKGCGDEPVPPFDPFMIQSIQERRAGLENAITGDKIVSSLSIDPEENAINGHEHNQEDTQDELQYACIFKLQEQKDCGIRFCECNERSDGFDINSPLCQSTEPNPEAGKQYYAKAYPSTRVLQVLKDFGTNSTVSSICPKPSLLSYQPTLDTLVDRMKKKFPPIIR